MSERRIAEEAEQESRRRLQQGTALEQAVAVGVGGAPELRRGERSAFLGQFPEQVLKAATFAVLDGKSVPESLVSALADRRCQHVFLAAQAVSKATPILRLVREHRLPLTIVQSPEYRGDTALVLVSDEPLQSADIWIGKTK